MPYDVTELGRYQFRWWLVVSWDNSFIKICMMSKLPIQFERNLKTTMTHNHRLFFHHLGMLIIGSFQIVDWKEVNRLSDIWDPFFYLWKEQLYSTKLIINVAFCAENPLVTGGFPAQRASNTWNVSMPWHHHEKELTCNYILLYGNLWVPSWVRFDAKLAMCSSHWRYLNQIQ